ncbi:MAG: 4-hydroxy-tetrahydrodipicolinate synthase [Deltaproteobacteria bacterium]|nr:MAG: 4-hydroxy-tetrahydrodipicolinate synthase [Deltaproteobacteria bacterium]
MFHGSCTALVTPFKDGAVDYEGLNRLVDFQVQNGITAILAVGTTGESPTLAWEEHIRVVDTVAGRTRGKCLCVAGAGSNNTAEALNATEHAVKAGADAVLLVDPYYNGPSSLEIRKEYIEPVARAFTDVDIIPYIIPGRTGAQMFPEDLAILKNSFANVRTVKEATGNLDNMRRTRKVCGDDFFILSGDDGLTYTMMTDAGIKAAGVISVWSNVAPGPVTAMVKKLADGDLDGAAAIRDAMAPLFDLVTVTTTETTPHGDVTCRARNPLALKTLMQILGMPSGPCRRPVGRMTPAGLEVVLAAARTVWKKHPEILAPVGAFFDVDVESRLFDPKGTDALVYADYA